MVKTDLRFFEPTIRLAGHGQNRTHQTSALNFCNPPTPFTEVKTDSHTWLKWTIRTSTSLLHALRGQNEPSEVVPVSYMLCLCQNGLFKYSTSLLHALWKSKQTLRTSLCGGQTGLPEVLQACYTIFRRQNEVFEVLEASYTIRCVPYGLSEILPQLGSCQHAPQYCLHIHNSQHVPESRGAGLWTRR